MKFNVARLCLITALTATCFFCRNVLNEKRPENSKLTAILNFKVAQLFDCGNDTLLADIYWIALIQYLGDGKVQLSDKAVLTPKILDTITFLDPKFVEAFYFVAIFVGGELRQPKCAARIIERGLYTNETDWRLPYIAGFNYYLFAHDEERAAGYYEKAAALSGSPNWLRGQAQILRAKIPSMLKEATVLECLLNATSDVAIRRATRKRLYSVLERIVRTAPSDKLSVLANQRLLRLKDFDDKQ